MTLPFAEFDELHVISDLHFRGQRWSSPQILILAPADGGPRGALPRKDLDKDDAAAAARARRAMIGRGGIDVRGVVRRRRIDRRHWGGHQLLGVRAVGLAAGA